jgi:hypothetical protein
MMADDIHEPTTTQSTTSSIPPYTHRATSTFADTPTQYEHTAVASTERYRFQDLPPFYGSALGDARNSGTAMGTGPIEAHRIDTDEWLSDNEWQNDPSISDYLMRGRGIELPPAREEGQVSDDDHAGSQIVIVRRGDIMVVSTSPPPRNASTIQDPPHSLPNAQPRAISGGREERPARGPFGRVGRRMGSWGQQIGRQAGAIGHQFGQRTEGWASAYSAGGGGYNPPVRPTRAVRPSTVEPSGPPQYEYPPSYEDTRADY